MDHRVPVLMFVLSVACTPPVVMDPVGRERLSSASSVAVAWMATPGARVECPSDEGMKTWEYPGSRLDLPGDPGSSVRLAALAGEAGPPVRLASGGTWETIVGQWTESIRVPPVDPALATARAFQKRERGGPAGRAWSSPPVELHDLARATGAPGADLVLVVEARRFVLLGCYFTFRPWFDARATLLEVQTGRVIWRQDCREDVGTASSQEFWPSDLAAHGGALYGREIERRAEACAAYLARALDGGPTGGGPPR